MGQLSALAITISVEVVVAIALLSAARWIERAAWARAALVVAAASLLTHPAAWWAGHYGLAGWPWVNKVVAIEGAVVLVEMIVLARFLPLRGWRALIVATAANLASFGVGVLLR